MIDKLYDNDKIEQNSAIIAYKYLRSDSDESLLQNFVHFHKVFKRLNKIEN